MAGQHCSAQQRVCEVSGLVTERQKNMVRELATYFPESVPDLAELDYASAAEWIQEHETKWMELPSKPSLSLAEFMEMTEVARR